MAMKAFRLISVTACLAVFVTYALGQSDYDVADHDVREVRSILEDDLQHKWTPLFWGVRRGNMDEIEREVARGADIDARDFIERTPLHIAAVSGHKDVVQYLIEKGADVNSRDKWGVTPLRRLELIEETRGWDRSDIAAIIKEHGGIKLELKDDYPGMEMDDDSD